MGNELSLASSLQQQSAKAACANMCEAVAKAVLEVAKLDDSFDEDSITTAAREVLKICEKQATKTATELVKAERIKQMVSKVQGAEALGRTMQNNLLFLELLKVALDEAAGADETLKPTGSGSSGSGTGSSGSGSGITITHPWNRKNDLGKGAFGTVYAAVDKNGLKFAVKEVPKHGVQESFLREEVKLLGQLSHENVVKLYGCAGDDVKFYMYMELMQGSVKDKIDQDGPIPQSRAKKYNKDLLQGLIYLHENDVIHRDIKCANLLLDVHGTVKLADMGISKIHDHQTMIGPAEDVAGTLPWMSPEVLSGQEGGKRSDVWSVGCTVFEMVKEAAPFQEDLPPVLIGFLLPSKIRALEHKKLVSEQEEFGPSLQDFLSRIFVKMEERPYADKVAEHLWAR